MRYVIRAGAVAGALLCWAVGPARAQEIRRADGECVARNMRIPREIVPHLPSRVEVRVEVAADGSIARIRIAPQVANERIARLIEASVRQCRWISADAPPAEYLVHVPIRFAK